MAARLKFFATKGKPAPSAAELANIRRQILSVFLLYLLQPPQQTFCPYEDSYMLVLPARLFPAQDAASDGLW